MIIAARCPTGAPKELEDIFRDTLATADQVRAEDAEEEQENNEVLLFHNLSLTSN